jgi:ATP-dependent protease HslVU (ClpYQ) peptidase subunit
MTVCIAALCQDGQEPHAVVAADRMVTLGSFIEFEHAVPKMVEGHHAIAMIAGDTLVAKRLTDDVMDASVAADVASLAQELAGRYDTVRIVHMEEAILRPRGLTLNSFYQAHQALNPNIVALLDNQMSDYNLGVELLLGGIDATGAHIYSVSNPGGTERLHDIIGYAAVGSGGIHAVQAMIAFGHSATAGYHETVYRAYAAKRRAEVAPGVGRDTDMAVISASGIHQLTDEEMGQLRSIYEDFESSSSNALKTKLSKFKLGEGDKNDDD